VSGRRPRRAFARQEGAGTLNLTGTNLYTGPTTVSGGELTLSGAGGSATGGALIVNSGAKLTLETARRTTITDWARDCADMNGGEFVVDRNAGANTIESTGQLNLSPVIDHHIESNALTQTQSRCIGSSRRGGVRRLFSEHYLGAPRRPIPPTSFLPYRADWVWLALTGTRLTSQSCVGNRDTFRRWHGIGFVTNNINLVGNGANTNGIRPLDFGDGIHDGNRRGGREFESDCAGEPRLTQTYNSMLFVSGSTYTIGSSAGGKTATVTSGHLLCCRRGEPITGSSDRHLGVRWRESKGLYQFSN